MTDKRRLFVYGKVRSGETFSDVGKTLGVSRQRASQLYNSARDEIEIRPNDPLYSIADNLVGDKRLVSQIVNTLHYYGIYTAADLGSLSDYRIRTMKRFGPRSESIVYAMRDIANDQREGDELLE